jgi:hypothetical protein
MNTYSLKYLHLLTFIFISTASCISKKDPPVWNNATIDATISKSPAYIELDKQKEFFSFHEKQDSLLKKTSEVKYVSKNINSEGFNNCRAFYNKSDTLWIDIGIATGFTATGFNIKYKDKTFYTQPYYFTDVITDEPAPNYKIAYQKLTLDKSVYKPGDSLYGYINFKSIETDNNNNRSEHLGKGYFRAKVKATRDQ